MNRRAARFTAYLYFKGKLVSAFQKQSFPVFRIGNVRLFFRQNQNCPIEFQLGK